jgi:hypothetical protein
MVGLSGEGFGWVTVRATPAKPLLHPYHCSRPLLPLRPLLLRVEKEALFLRCGRFFTRASTKPTQRGQEEDCGTAHG